MNITTASAQRILLQYILRPLSAPFAHLSEKSRENLIFSCFLGFFIVCFLRSYFSSLRALYFLIPDCILLGIIILCGVTPKTAPVRWKPVFFASWLGVALFSCLAAVFYKVDYFADGVLYLIALPIFWMVWGQRDCDILFHCVIRAAKWSFWLLLPVLAIFYPVGDAGYMAFFGNPNRLALYLAAVFCAFLFDCFTLGRFCGKMAVNAVSSGICAALLFYTASRGGEFVSVIASVLAALFLLLLQGRKAVRCVLTSLLSVAIAVLCCVPSILYAMDAVYTNTRFVRETLTTHNGIDLDAYAPDIAAPDWESIVDFNRYKIVDSKDKDLRTYTSNRSELWVIYGSRLTPLGHDGSESLYFADGREANLSPHLTVLNVAYNYGFIAGVCYLAFNIATGIYCILYALRRRDSVYGLFPFLFTLAFGAYSLVESIDSPFGCAVAFVYYLAQAPIVLKQIHE